MNLKPLPILLVAALVLGAAQAQEATSFTVRLENVSTSDTLTTSEGAVPVPLSPGVWVIHQDGAPLFRGGEADRGQGLEAIAEDGNPAALGAYLAGDTMGDEAMGEETMGEDAMGEETMGDEAMGDETMGDETMGEDAMEGDGMMAEHPMGILHAGVFNTPVGEAAPGPLLPGGVYEFTVEAHPGDRLTFATMFVQSNDLFYAPDESGIALFDADGTPVSGDVSDLVALWDAGTEANQEPGTGADQAPRQAGPDTGAAEDGLVTLVLGDARPDTMGPVLKVTITPAN